MVSKRLVLFTAFIRAFLRYALHIREVIVSLVVLIALGGFVISYVEGIRLVNAIYFAFITGLTIGYGDITPETLIGKIVSIAIGLIGVLFTGITVAIANRALAHISQQYLETKS